jgi:hypothetical protein
MPPKLKQASMLPAKATKKEPGVEKLTSAIAKTLKITTPPFQALLYEDPGWVHGKALLIMLRLIFTLQARYRSMHTRPN